MKKLILILIIILLAAAGFYYWAVMRTPNAPDRGGVVNLDEGNFNPFNRPGDTSGATGTNEPVPTSSSITDQPILNDNTPLPKLRQLSATPVGGYMASTTASSTLARYVDRGVGHIYEAMSDSPSIPKISNTTIPRVYESYWNRNATAGVFRYMKDEAGTIVNFFAEIRPIAKNASTTDENTMPYEVKGRFLSPSIQEIAVSPKADKIFTFAVENGKGVGYTSGFDESKKTEIISTPMTQVNVDWPEENTVAITTKASGVSTGFLYLVDLKKPFLKKIVGGVTGLTAKVSSDAKKVIFSSASSRLTTYLHNIVDGSTQEVVFRTLAEKCVWSKLDENEVYCAVPTEVPRGIYPDDWYKGNVSFVDQIWYLNTGTGEVRLIANLLNLSNDLIDVINPSLDPKENFLYFVNKRDLTLWSMDLN